MPNDVCIRVAGIAVRAWTQQANVRLHVAQPDDKFLVNPDEPALDLEVVVGRLPSVPDAPRLFRSGNTWSLRSDGDTHWLAAGWDAMQTGIGRVVIIHEQQPPGKLIISPGARIRGLTDTLEGPIVDPFAFPLLEVLVYWQLARTGGTCFHASGVVQGGRACAFAGTSGQGKTTIARIMQQAGRDVLSDDRVGLSTDQGRLLLHGTPWHGTPALATPAGAPLAGFFFIEHGERTEALPLPAAEACARLVAAACPPYFSRDLMGRVVATCAEIADTVPCYRLPFRRDLSALEVVETIIGA